MTFKGVFVDDQDDEYAEMLSSDRLLISFMKIDEVARLGRAILDEEPMVVALDYRLDEAPGKLQPDQLFKGSVLAQHLREAGADDPSRDFALVLVSAEMKIRTAFKHEATAHDLFDRVYVKEEINRDRERVRAELVGLASGYRQLQQMAGNFDPAEILQLTDDERGVVDTQEIRARLQDRRSPHLVASALLKDIIGRPGLLLDTAEAAAYLGVTREAFKGAQAVLDGSGAAYSGVFSDPWRRWWRHRVETWAEDLLGNRVASMPAADRARLLSEKVGIELAPALSPWTGQADELISFACACCRRGTEMRHSLGIFEAALPRFARRRRICWDCIQTDRCEREPNRLVIDEADQPLVAKIKSMPRTLTEGQSA